MSNQSKPAPRRGLGRGLGSLIPTAPREADQPADSTPGHPTPGDGTAAQQPPAVSQPELVGGSYFAELPVDQIVPNRVQPRQVFDEDALAELVHSVKEVGLLQPIVVRPLGEGEYEL